MHAPADPRHRFPLRSTLCDWTKYTRLGALLAWGALAMTACRAEMDTPAERRESRREAAVDAHDPVASAQSRGESEASASRSELPDQPGLPQASDRERAGLGLLSAIDQYEVDAARLALSRDLDPSVRDYAEKIQREHAEDRGALDAWMPDTGNAQAQTQLRQGQQTLAALRGADRAAFQPAYIEATLHSHAQTLALLDHSLLPQARSPELQAQLRRSRSLIEHHLGAARRLPGASAFPREGDTP